MKRLLSSLVLCGVVGISPLLANTIPANYSKPFEGVQDFGAATNLDNLLVGENTASGTGEASTATAPSSPIQAAALSAPVSSGLSNYPQVVQNIVRATDGDAAKIFDLIRNHIEFQPYFGFKKDVESVWFSRRANDADQTLLLVECLRAAGYSADYRFGLIFMTADDARAWFGADDLNSLIDITGNAGYFSGSASNGTLYALEQIWCEATIDGTVRGLSPAYKTYDEVAGIDLAAAMNYTRAGLQTAAGGTETADYVEGVSESGVNSYLQARAMDLVQELQTNHPTAAVDEIISGRRIQQSNVASDYSDSFYSPNSFISSSYDTFVFPDPYTDWGFNGTTYRFYTLMNVAIGNVTSSGTQFTAQPFIFYQGPSAEFSGKKISFNFTDTSLAEIRIDGELKAQEASLNAGNIGVGYAIFYPFARSGAGTAFDEVRIRPIQRGRAYAYVYDNGGSGAVDFSRQSRLQLDQYRRAGSTPSDQDILTETLHLLGLDWLYQFDLSVEMLSKINNFTPVIHHTMALVQQELGFGVDIPTTTLPIPNNENTGQNSENLRSIVLLGSAMEHSVIEQNYPTINAVSTVRFVRENNLAGGKTYLATSANYASSIQTDPDFIAGWTSFYRNTVFDSAVNNGRSLVIPEDGNIVIDDLDGLGYFDFGSGGVAALIFGGLNGGFATTSGQIDFFLNPYPFDPTWGPDNLENPLSFEPIDMLTGAYVYDGTDLSLSGEGVRGLTFSRHYSSLASGSNTGLGKGWSHNHQSSIVEHSDNAAAFGEATPVHAASAIASMWAIRDMMELETSAKAWVVGSLAAYWALEEIENNTVTLAMGRRTLPFTKLADGSFLPPAGMTGILTQDSGTGAYSLEERFDVVADFNTDNKLASITDADGNQMTYSYFPSGGANEGKLQTVTDHYNRTLTFTYTNDLLSKVADSTGRDVDFDYTGELLTGVTDPEDHTATYAYDAQERIENVFNKKGEKIAQNTYDEFQQVCFQVAEDDAAQEWEYAFTGILNVEINPDDEFLSYAFDEIGRTVSVTNGADNKSTMAYDGQNQLIRRTDPRGNITRFEYDDRNNLRFTYDARNGASGTTYKIEQQYDAEDRLFKLIGEEDNETVYHYDAEHHLEKVTDPLLREISYTYFSSGAHDGLIETITTPGATVGQTHVTTLAYDAKGYPNSITRPDTSVVTQTFNARGDLTFAEVTTTGETNTYPITNAYDLNRRLLTTADDLGFGATIVYDAVGNVISTADRFGNESTATYSPLARLETTTGSNDETTLFGYDDSGRRNQITNPLSQVSNLGYDNAGRLETTSNPLNETVTQSYDAAGNRTGLTNARNKLYQFSFNANNLQESSTTPLNRTSNYTYDDRLLLKTSEEPSTQTVAYKYHDDGLLEQTVDPTGTIDFAYDAKGRLETVTEGTDVITRAYDSLDRVISFTDSQGSAISYEYDGGDNLTKLIYPASKGDVDYEYDDAGRLIKVTDWANRETEFFYGGDSHLMEMRLPNGTKREYFYDAAGRVERQVDTHIASGIGFLDQQYKFDALSRIIEERVSPEPAPYVITPTTMVFDDDDRITNWQNGAANINPVFDDDGNMTTGVLGGVSETFVYDSRNRLTQVGSTSYVYDAEGRRISKTEGGVTTVFVHDPYSPLSRLLQKTTGSTTTYYVYAGGQLLYEEENGQIRVYHFDSRGSTLAITDSSGLVMNRITYGAYGEIVAATTVPSALFLYNGAYGVQADLNGLLQMRARYYSPELRRFINADPISFGGGINLYSFAGGNPVGGLDPSGLSTVRIATQDANGDIAVSTIIDPSIDNFRAAIAGTEDGSIIALEIIGHGTSDTLVVEPGASGNGLVNLGRNDGIVYSDDASDFVDSISPKLAPSASICLGGCNTANDREGVFGSEENISKRLSEDLPDVAVTGYRGFAFGNEVAIPWDRDHYIRVGKENYSLGVGRTYMNGEDLGQRSEFLFKEVIKGKDK